MKAYLYFLKRGKPREEDWLDRTLLSAGTLIKARRKEVIFQPEDEDSLQNLRLPAIVIIENGAHPEKLYFLCDSFEVRDERDLHLFGKSL